jgi:hypothetical protein
VRAGTPARILATDGATPLRNRCGTKKMNLLSAYSTRQDCRRSQRLAGELLIRKLIGYLVERRRRTQEPVPRIEIEPSAVRDGEWSDGTAGPEANVLGAFAQDLINRIGRQRRAMHSPALVEHERGHGGDVRRSCGGPKEIGECIGSVLLGTCAVKREKKKVVFPPSGPVRPGLRRICGCASRCPLVSNRIGTPPAEE